MTNQSSQTSRYLSAGWIAARTSSWVLLAALMAPSTIVAQQSATVNAGQKTSSTTSSAQIDPRSGTPATAGGKTGSAGTQDDGFGACPAFSHYHMGQEEFAKAWSNGTLDARTFMQRDTERYAELDGLCHRDDNDAVILDIHEPLPNQKWDWL